MLIHDCLCHHADHIHLLMASLHVFFLPQRYCVKASAHRGWCHIQHSLSKKKIFMYSVKAFTPQIPIQIV